MVAGLLLVAGAAAAGPAPRAAPRPEAVSRARVLVKRADNLRHLRVPLRQRRAARSIGQAVGRLRRLGVKIDTRVPVVLDSAQEYGLLRQASKLLRGAPKGSPAYDLRKKAVVRARKLHKTTYRLPRNMRAYANGDKGHAELVINLDSAFYAKPKRLQPILAHEYKHIGDIKRALRLEKMLQQPGLANAKQGTKQYARKQKFQQQVKVLWSRPRAETRAFFAQARAQGLAGQPLGMWWRAPQGGAMDKGYPPAQLNRALIKGFFKGLTQSVSSAMRDASPEKRALAGRYLRGYRGVLTQQASAYFAAVRKDDRRDPAAIERYNAGKSTLLQEAGRLLTQPGPLTTKRALMAGQTDAYQGTAPTQRVLQILGAGPR